MRLGVWIERVESPISSWSPLWKECRWKESQRLTLSETLEYDKRDTRACNLILWSYLPVNVCKGNGSDGKSMETYGMHGCIMVIMCKKNGWLREWDAIVTWIKDGVFKWKHFKNISFPFLILSLFISLSLPLFYLLSFWPPFSGHP